MVSESDLSSNKSCSSSCNCRNPNRPNPEYEVASSSSSSNVFDNTDYSSESSLLTDYKVKYKKYTFYNMFDVMYLMIIILENCRLLVETV